MGCCGTKHKSGNGSQLKAPYFCQHINGIIGIWVIYRQYLFHSSQLCLEAFIGDIGASAGGVGRGFLKESSGNSCTGGGVGYTHFTG